MRIVIVGGRGVGASIAEYFSKRGDDVVVIEGDESSATGWLKAST